MHSLYESAQRQVWPNHPRLVTLFKSLVSSWTSGTFITASNVIKEGIGRETNPTDRAGCPLERLLTKLVQALLVIVWELSPAMILLVNTLELEIGMLTPVLVLEKVLVPVLTLELSVFPTCWCFTTRDLHLRGA